MHPTKLKVTISSNGYVFESFIAIEPWLGDDPHGVAGDQFAGRIRDMIAERFATEETEAGTGY